MLSQGRKVVSTAEDFMDPSNFLHVQFTIPTSFARQLEKITRDFLWSKHDRDNGFDRVSWDEIYRPKQDGWVRD